MRWLPALGIMALLFALSAQPDLSTGWSFDVPLRTAGHMVAYAALWLALLYALGGRRPVAATVVALAYAVSDEWHQSFVAGRDGSAGDVAIDALGMGLAAVGWRWWKWASPSGRGKRRATRLSPSGDRKRPPSGDVTGASRARSR